MAFQGFVATDVGVKRKSNEDNFCSSMEMGLFVIADGMGGHAAGEVASRIAVEEIRSVVLQSENVTDSWPKGFDQNLSLAGNRLRCGIEAANEKIRRTTMEHAECRGMGTTVVAMLATEEICTIAHVGDSRAYLFRDSKLSGLTSDHSWVNEQLKQGFLTEEHARTHPFRNVITQALGSGPEVQVDVMELEVESNDLVLLCSDGLNSMLSDEEINDVIQSHESLPLDTLTNKLIDAAKDKGGDDNITVGLVRFSKVRGAS